MRLAEGAHFQRLLSDQLKRFVNAEGLSQRHVGFVHVTIELVPCSQAAHGESEWHRLRRPAGFVEEARQVLRRESVGMFWGPELSVASSQASDLGAGGIWSFQHHQATGFEDAVPFLQRFPHITDVFDDVPIHQQIETIVGKWKSDRPDMFGGQTQFATDIDSVLADVDSNRLPTKGFGGFQRTADTGSDFQEPQTGRFA